MVQTHTQQTTKEKIGNRHQFCQPHPDKEIFTSPQQYSVRCREKQISMSDDPRETLRYTFSLYEDTKRLKVLNSTDSDQFIWFGNVEDEINGFLLPPRTKAVFCLCNLNRLNLRNGPMSEMRVTYMDTNNVLHRILNQDYYEDVYCIDSREGVLLQYRRDLYKSLPTVKAYGIMAVRPKTDFGIFRANTVQTFPSCRCENGGRNLGNWKLADRFHTQYREDWSFVIYLNV